MAARCAAIPSTLPNASLTPFTIRCVSIARSLISRALPPLFEVSRFLFLARTSSQHVSVPCTRYVFCDVHDDACNVFLFLRVWPSSEYGCYRQRHQGCRLHSEGNDSNALASTASLTFTFPFLLPLMLCIHHLSHPLHSVFGTFEEDRKGVASTVMLLSLSSSAAMHCAFLASLSSGSRPSMGGHR